MEVFMSLELGTAAAVGLSSAAGTTPTPKLVVELGTAEPLLPLATLELGSADAAPPPPPVAAARRGGRFGPPRRANPRGRITRCLVIRPMRRLHGPFGRPKKECKTQNASNSNARERGRPQKTKAAACLGPEESVHAEKTKMV